MAYRADGQSKHAQWLYGLAESLLNTQLAAADSSQIAITQQQFLLWLFILEAYEPNHLTLCLLVIWLSPFASGNSQQACIEQESVAAKLGCPLYQSQLAYMLSSLCLPHAAQLRRCGWQQSGHCMGTHSSECCIGALHRDRASMRKRTKPTKGHMRLQPFLWSATA